jgi:hypothetical protein
MIVARWAARTLGSLIAGFVVTMAVAQGFNPMDLNTRELALASAMFVALVGMVALWRWEGIGGSLVIAGMLAFCTIYSVATGPLPAGPVIPTFFAPGVLALACWIWRE